MKRVNYSKMFANWKGITYPTLRSGVLPEWVYSLWRLLFCKRGFHLFDEVIVLNGHQVVCDACELVVWIDDEHQESH